MHDVWAYVQLLGVDRMVRLTGDGTPGAPAAGPALTGGRLALPYWTGSGQLALDVDQRQRRFGPDTAGAAAPTPRAARRSLPLPYVAAAPDGTPARVKVTVSPLTVNAELLPTPDDGTDATTAQLRLPARLKLPAGRHPVTLPKTNAPLAYAVVRDGTLLRLEGPAYEAGTGRRFLDSVADNRQVRRRQGRSGSAGLGTGPGARGSGGGAREDSRCRSLSRRSRGGPPRCGRGTGGSSRTSRRRSRAGPGPAR